MKNNDVPVIRVKEFAKIEFLPSKNENNNSNGNKVASLPLSIDIETISLSSEEEISSNRNKTTKYIAKTPKTPKTRGKRLPRVVSSVSKGRTPKLPSKYKFHKIDEYFQATKKDYKNGFKKSTSISLFDKKQEMTNSQRYATGLKQVKIVLRRLSIDQQVDTSRKRKAQDDQTKLPDFIEHESSEDTYFKVYEHSSLPKQSLAQLKTIDSNSLHIKCKTEENNLYPPDILCPNDIHIDTSSTIKETEQRHGIQENAVNYNLRKKTKTTESIDKAMKKVNNAPKNDGKISKKPAMRKSKVECPHYKIVEGTTFAVDAFRYGDIESVEHYFLTHFHADHYIGLKKSFNHKLYVSYITGRLVMELIKVEEQYIRYVDINTPVIIEDVEVTALDANHCPGAVMYLFKLKTGKCMLHTGDFRASPEMEEYPEFWNNEIHTIYLDTTYLSSKYEFSTQSESVYMIVQYVKEFINSSTSSSGKHLIICGAYKVGKEKVWLRIAQEFNYKVWIDSERQKVMQCIQNDEISDVLTRYAKDASIHVLPLGNISYQFIVDYVRQFGETFCKVLAIRPSGWEKQKSKPNFANKISILGVQYSEHSSFSELERFVRFLQPKKVISTVPFNGKNLNRTPKVPDSWLNHKVEPKSKSYQRNIMDFMIKEPIVKNQTKMPQETTEKKVQQIMESISIDEDDDYLP